MEGLDSGCSQGGDAQRRRRSPHSVEQPDRGKVRPGVPLGRRGRSFGEKCALDLSVVRLRAVRVSKMWAVDAF